MNLLEYLKLRNISFEDILKKKLKTAMDLPFNNRTDYGNSIKTQLADTISISNPKCWPKKGYSEKIK